MKETEVLSQRGLSVRDTERTWAGFVAMRAVGPVAPAQVGLPLFLALPAPAVPLAFQRPRSP